ncbi:GRAS family protein [Cohnella panacarvi]|uniref:GRAS family protein n=1 Tax=Cohnella panacarvi TaxID=400776 RepID=UPI000478D4B1|nr:GRAS family protein [Cohnella panacarvi]
MIKRLSSWISTLRMEEEGADLIAYLFGKAFMSRLDRSRMEVMNLYLRQHDVPQIELFNLLCSKFPVAMAAGTIANRCLVNAAEGADSLKLLEIGIGTGRQIVLLIQSLAAMNKPPVSLTIHAIEPDPASLGSAEASVRKAAEEAGIHLDFHGCARTMEDVEAEFWNDIQASDGRLLVNAAFSLHHVHGGAPDAARKILLSRIHSLKPTLVVLCEPDSDHFVRDVRQRFAESWRHYSNVFRLIDQCDITAQEKRSLKIFFSREIEDVLGVPETDRVERHERTASWIQRLQLSGFEPANPLQTQDLLSWPLLARRIDEWHVGLSEGNINLVSIICASSR